MEKSGIYFLGRKLSICQVRVMWQPGGGLVLVASAFTPYNRNRIVFIFLLIFKGVVIITEKFDRHVPKQDPQAVRQKRMQRLGKQSFALILAGSLLYGISGQGLSLWQKSREAERIRQQEQLSLETRKQRLLETYQSARASADQAAVEGDYHTAQSLITECLNLVVTGDPLEAELRTARASLSLLDGNPQAALPDLQRSLELTPENPRLLLLKSQAELDLGNPVQAAADLRAYLSLEPEDLTAMETAARLSEAEGSYREAGDWYETLSQKKDSPDYAFSAARCRMLSGEYERADSLLHGLLDSKPADPGPLYFHLGLNAMLREDYGAAPEAFFSALEAGQDPAACLEQAALSCHLSQDHQLLLDIAGQYSRLPTPGPGAAQVYGLAGSAAMALGENWEAENYFEKSLRLEPDQPAVRFQRGVCLFAGKRYKDAAEDFTAAIQAGHEAQLAYYNRSICRLRLGHRAGALEDMAQAAGITDDPALAKEALALLNQMKQQRRT